MSIDSSDIKDLVIVSDPGIDDAIALVLIEKLLPGVPKLLVSSFGNFFKPCINRFDELLNIFPFDFP